MNKKRSNRIYSYIIIVVAFYYAIMIQVSPAITSPSVKEKIGYITIALMALAVVALIRIITGMLSRTADNH